MPPDIDVLKQSFRDKAYILTQHASERAIQRDIDAHEIEEAVITGEVIEDYPDDKYGASCLISGKTKAGRALHIHMSYPPTIKVITAYEPSPDRWHTDLKTRKNNDT